MVLVVAAVTPSVVDFITGECKRPLDGLVGHPPITAKRVDVGAAVLQIDAQRLGLALADQHGITIAAAEIDIGADRAENAAKRVGTLPGGRKSTNGTAAGPRDTAIVTIVRKPDRPAVGSLPLLDGRQQFLDQKPGVVVARGVVLDAAVVTVEGRLLQSWHPTWGDEDSDGHGHFMTVDQLIEHHWGVVLDAVLIHVEACGLGWVVLLGDIDPAVADRAGKYLAVGKIEFGDFALGRRLGRPRRLVGPQRSESPGDQQCAQRDEAAGKGDVHG